MTEPFIVGRSGLTGFGFHLRFEATSWRNAASELETAIGLLTAYRTALMSSAIQASLTDRTEGLEIPIVWGQL